MSEPFVGQIICLGCSFAPVNWLDCNGQLLPISQYDVLYALLGTTYGGDGVSTFGLPDLRGRAPVHAGQGQGLSPRFMGEAAGSTAVTLTAATMPAHTHAAATVAQPADQAVPAANLYLSDEGPSGVPISTYQAYNPGTQVSLSSASVGLSSGGVGHENRQPYQAVTFAIATAGIFPSQN